MANQDSVDHGSSQLSEERYPNIPNRPDLGDKFRDIDDPDSFAECRQHLMDERTQNFVVDFGNDDARCAINLEVADFSALMEATRPKSFETRWINIWAPEHQKNIVKVIANRYEVSARLQVMMCSDPADAQQVTSATPRLTSEPFSPRTDPSEKHNRVSLDLESGGRLDAVSGVEAVRARPGLGRLSFSQIVDEIWHFASVDYGSRYLCLGYNSLYTVSGVNFRNGHSRPKGKRVWAWLILCDDGTVVSIQENPFPHPDSFSESERSYALEVIRRNVAIIFSAISKHHGASENSNPLMTTHVRNFPTAALPNASPQVAVKSGDAPSLLFYYLFDDWATNYSLVVRGEDSYGVALDRLRRGMLERAKVDLIDDLHQLGRQLAVLKRLYQSYELLVTRILKRQRWLRDEARHHHQGGTFVSAAGSDSYHFQPPRFMSWRTGLTEDGYQDGLGGVQLSFAATGRFERLADRIRLYALSEIEECLTEKESLTFLVFNLIALKDSQAVEKLTRTTVLLAEVTILFLPVSLMTGYFSTQIQDLQGIYTVKTYWISFAAIIGLSILGLVVFRWASDAIEGKTIYRSLAKTLYDSSRATMSRRKSKVA